MNNLNRSMLRFTNKVALGMLWLFWLLVFMSTATCAAVFVVAS